MKNLIYKISIILLLTSTSGFASLGDGPSIDSDHSVHLGANIAKALNEKYPNFKLLEINQFAPTIRGYVAPDEAPMAVLGDFNRDKKPDIVVMGTTGTGERVVLAVLSDKGSYKVVKVDGLDFHDPKEAQLENEGHVQKGLYQYLSRARYGSKDAFQFENLRASGDMPALIFSWNGSGFGAYTEELE